MNVNISARALVANETMEKIILERFLSDTMPKFNKFSLTKICIYTDNNYYRLRNYIKSDLYKINTNTVDITDDTQLLSNRSKQYVEKLIKNVISPTKHKNDKFVCLIAKLYDNSYFTEEELNFIEMMTEEFCSIINYNKSSHRISVNDLIGFQDLNHSPFLNIAQQVYNNILQNNIHAGDNIIGYIKAQLTDVQVNDKLEKSRKYDYFFDSNGILKCDLKTDTNILIKNFLSTILSRFTDNTAKTILLLKLNNKYPLLITDKIF